MQEKKILIVDDDDGHRQMLKVLLEDWGYKIDEAQDGAIAVEKCKEKSFSLVLMDIRMPKMNGLEALQEIKSYNPAMPVLIMTAFSAIETAVEAIKEGAYDYLTKPLDFDKLKISLKNIFDYSSLVEENVNLSDSLKKSQAGSDIVGSSEALSKTLEMVHTIAPSEATVLITGESGTGKELIAKAIHQGSNRKKDVYVAVNCAALTETLLESELFGHEKGSFTGADRQHEGRFVQAQGGTLFLDEIGEMPLSMQVKLLRVLQEREVVRVGGSEAIPVDVRIVAATNRDLKQEVENKKFREDLYYRLNVVTIKLPSLRERDGDIPILANYFLKSFAEKNNKIVKGFTPEAMGCLVRYNWPGNVRELENVIERGVVLLLSDHISERELPDHIKNYELDPKEMEKGSLLAPLEDIERAAILQTLDHVGGNKTEAAKRLGITRKTLHTKLTRYEKEDEEKGK